MISCITFAARRSFTVAMAAAVFLPIGAVSAQSDPVGQAQEIDLITHTAVARADCGPGSAPESGLQGDVPAADRDSGRSRAGYSCNIQRIGDYAGRGGGISSVSFEHCIYVGTFFPGNLLGPEQGVQVLDVSDPTAPIHTATLTEPAMLAGTWESLKVNETRKLLVGAGAPVLTGAGLLSVYDISDCAHPRLLNPGTGTDLAMPLPITAHEGGFSPDGNTYWSSGVAPGLVSAVDLRDPANPRVIWQDLPGLSMHGFGFSPDGNRMYLANNLGGLKILDVSAVQRRDPDPRVRQLADMTWTDGWATQHNIPVTYAGKPYLLATNEAGSGGVKVIDVSDGTDPRIVNTIKLEIDLPENQDSALASASGGSLFSYDAHYCAADRPANPTALACSWTSSGIRVFDIRDPFDIREIGYFNPPARTGHNTELWNSPHALASIIGPPLLATPAVAQAMLQGQFDPSQATSPRTGDLAFGDLSTDWCFSAPEWRGTQLWTTCADNGFLALRLAPAVYTPPADQHSTIGS
ncbi:LVIVD repeat-containing protein [Nocardia nepalensis]|uniref:LVIVD repeat-containing protein n=1 Tax=Nocardia nepalensis TaxID=3375448 RepID=UPI003B66B0AF